MGANVPGKPRILLPYIGGVNVYQNTCREIAADNYRGFHLDGTAPQPRQQLT
jgi:cyclohexanone monooxygenase